MKDVAIGDERSFCLGEKSDSSLREIPRVKSAFLLKHMFKALIASFNSSFETDWDKNATLQWEEWAKL